jgi:hypothetical protein
MVTSSLKRQIKHIAVRKKDPFGSSRYQSIPHQKMIGQVNDVKVLMPPTPKSAGFCLIKLHYYCHKIINPIPSKALASFIDDFFAAQAKHFFHCRNCCQINFFQFFQAIEEQIEMYHLKIPDQILELFTFNHFIPRVIF